jgi:hypothetical protein
VLNEGLKNPHREKNNFCYYDLGVGRYLSMCFCIRQVLGKTLGYNEIVHQLSIHFKKACDSVRNEVAYNDPIKPVVPLKLIRFIKMCFNETYNKST